MRRIRSLDSKPVLSLTALIILAFLISGCANLKSIKEFATISSDTETYQRLTDDYVKSPDRQKYYTELKKEREERARICEERQQQLKGIIALNQIVAEYMDALGQLASDELISYDKEVGSWVEGLKQAQKIKGSPIEDKQIEAFQNLSNLLLKAFTDAYRQGKLKEVIEQANPNLQIILNAQKKIVGVEYVRSFEVEKEKIDSYYGDILVVAGGQRLLDSIKKQDEREQVSEYYGELILEASKDPAQKAALMLLRDRMQERKDEVAAKQQAALIYVKVLDRIATGHQMLYDKRNQISSDQVLAAIRTYAKDIGKLYQTMNALK